MKKIVLILALISTTQIKPWFGFFDGPYDDNYGSYNGPYDGDYGYGYYGNSYRGNYRGGYNRNDAYKSSERNNQNRTLSKNRPSRGSSSQGSGRR